MTNEGSEPWLVVKKFVFLLHELGLEFGDFKGQIDRDLFFVGADVIDVADFVVAFNECFYDFANLWHC